VKILLVVPPSDFLAQGYGVKAKVKAGQLPPLGVGYIAAYLERAGHEVGILDATAMELTVEQAVDQVASAAPELVGLSVLTNYAPHAKQLAAAIKRRLPQVKIVLGGAHATYFYEEILDDMPAVDHVLYGEVDTVIADYVQALGSQADFSKIAGLVHRDGATGKIVVNPPPAAVADLDATPMPAWHLYDLSLYRPLPFQARRKPVFTMITSRGCQWARCTFCFQAGYSKAAFRRNSPERTVDEIEILHRKFGIGEIHFWDDTFIYDEEWMARFVGELKRRRLDVTWVASGRVSAMTEAMIRLIKEGGCWNVFLGIESGNQGLLKAMKKGITLTQVRNALDLLNRHGIQTRAAFMLGLPGETPEMGRKTIEFAIEIDPTYAIFYAAHPRKGTELFDEAMNVGQFLSSEYLGMSRITYVPERYESAESLAKLIREAYRRFYLRPRYVWGVLCRIRTLDDLRELVLAGLLYAGLSDIFNPVRATASRMRQACGTVTALAFGPRARGN